MGYAQFGVPRLWDATSPYAFSAVTLVVSLSAASASNSGGSTIYFYANASGRTFQLKRQYAVRYLTHLISTLALRSDTHLVV